MKVKHLVILIVFVLVVLQILRKKKYQKESIQLIKNNLYSELKKINDKNKKRINELEELLQKEERWSFYLSVFTVLSICGLSIYIYMLIRKSKNQTKKYLDTLRENANSYVKLTQGLIEDVKSLENQNKVLKEQPDLLYEKMLNLVNSTK